MEEPECFLTATDRSEGVETSENFFAGKETRRWQQPLWSLFGLSFLFRAAGIKLRPAIFEREPDFSPFRFPAGEKETGGRLRRRRQIVTGTGQTTLLFYAA